MKRISILKNSRAVGSSQAECAKHNKKAKYADISSSKAE